MIWGCGKIGALPKACQLQRHLNESFQFKTGLGTLTAFFARTPSCIFDRASLNRIGNGHGALTSKVVPLVRAKGAAESVLMGSRPPRIIE
jgi:hypothetical protein